MFNDLLINFFIRIIFINNQPNLELKIINNGGNEIFFQNNLNYHSVSNFRYKSEGLIYVLSNPKKLKENNFDFRAVKKSKNGFYVWLISADTNSEYEKILRRNGHSLPIFKFEKRAIKHMNKNASVISLASKDSIIYNLTLHPNLFLKKSYCSHGSILNCPPLKEDSLDIYAYLKFKYSFDDKVKARDFSHFYLTSDTIRFKLK